MLESYLHRLLGSYLRNVDRFLVPSRFYLRKLVEWGFPAERFEYVPNFVATESFEAELRARQAVRVFRPPLARERHRHADPRGRGGGSRASTSSARARRSRAAHARGGPDVRFLGFLTGAKLNAAVASARAVVVPSEWYENAPLAVLEAAALGKPLIVARHRRPTRARRRERVGLELRVALRRRARRDACAASQTCPTATSRPRAWRRDDACKTNSRRNAISSGSAPFTDDLGVTWP